jgi:hypothetical protein|tara:strand:- start:948 stop:1088 length:141 start_codon:yes stop_codon:yes gene_type:complete
LTCQPAWLKEAAKKQTQQSAFLLVLKTAPLPTIYKTTNGSTAVIER